MGGGVGGRVVAMRKKYEAEASRNQTMVRDEFKFLVFLPSL